MPPRRRYPGPPPGRATSPDEKREVVEALLGAWLANPCLRLGQLVSVAHGRALGGRPGPDLFNVEDEALVDALDAMPRPREPRDAVASTIPLPFPEKPLRAGPGRP